MLRSPRRRAAHGVRITALIEDAFSVVPIEDERLPEPVILFVHNTEEFRPNGQRKPSGFGLPGGGVKKYDLETPIVGARTELRDETGLDLLGPDHIVPAVVAENPICRLAFVGPGYRLRYVPFTRGARPAIPHVPRGCEVFEIVFHLFKARVRFEETPHQELFRRARLTDALGTRSLLKFAEMDPLEVAALGIKEIDEIDGLGLFSPSFLAKVAEGRIGNPGFYPSHLHLALEAMGS